MSNMKMRDEQMIFLISLPRSGSTMLQKMLGCHSEIYTRSEPWLMLHPLHTFKNKNIKASYNSKWAVDGVKDFIAGISDDGEKYYFEQIRRCYLSLYNQYLTSSQKKRFLDKTPRYYEIFDELQLTFPNAKFIILYRNPISVFSSILTTWIKENWELLKNYKVDLEQGIDFLTRDFSSYTNTYCLQYEKLVEKPQDEFERLFKFLELEFEPACIQYGRQHHEKWIYGDPETVYTKTTPDSLQILKWQESLKSPEHYKLIKDYLGLLGEERMNSLGYDYYLNKSIIEQAKNNYKHPEIIDLELGQYLVSDEQILYREKNRTQLYKEKVESGNVEINNLNSEINELKKIISKKIDENNSLKNIADDLNKEVDQKKSQIDLINKAFESLISFSIYKKPYKKMLAYKNLLLIISELKKNK